MQTITYTHALLQSNSDTNQFVMSWATCYRTD